MIQAVVPDVEAAQINVVLNFNVEAIITGVLAIFCHTPIPEYPRNQREPEI